MVELEDLHTDQTNICFTTMEAEDEGSWCLGMAAASDCGTLWTFLLPFWDPLNLA